jgi:hypothetical protein
MSAFEDFVQQELPKRGYLNTDVGQETIIVRRGVGPRQFDAIQLAEGQVLGLVDGVLVGVSRSSLVRKYVQSFTGLTTWTLTHSLNSENVIVQAFDNNKFVLIPDSIQIIDENVVRLMFNSAQTGTARVIFLD